MKKVTIVGIGVGKDTVTPEALTAIREADVLLGAQRVLDFTRDELGIAGKRAYPKFLPDDVLEFISGADCANGSGIVDGANGSSIADNVNGSSIANGVYDSNIAERYAVLVSGDVGFYSAAAKLTEAMPSYEGMPSFGGMPSFDVRLIPGVSTVNAFFARLKIPWQDAALVSVHGRDTEVAGTVRRNRMTFCLTGGNVSDICSGLIRAGYGQIRVYVGSDIGAENERIFFSTVENLINLSCPPMTVLLFQNDNYVEKTPIGLPDGSFQRIEGIPMTKSETRAIVMSKMNLAADSI